MKKYSILEIKGGCGKNILATSVCEAIKQENPDYNLIVITAYPEVFLNNPNVYRVFRLANTSFFYDEYIKGNDIKFFCEEPYLSKGFLNQSKHIIECWTDTINVTPLSQNKPSIYLSFRELQYMSNNVDQTKPILLIQPFGGANDKLSYSWNRDIPPHQAQQIIDKLYNEYNVIQISRDNQLKLNNCNHFQGNLRELFALIQLSHKGIGIDSIMQHCAAAFDKSQTICWITNDPKVWGYDIHTNILPEGDLNYISNIDSYFHKYDFTGNRFYDFPFKTGDIFNIDDIIESINE